MTCGHSLGKGKKTLQAIVNDYNRRIQVVDAETSKGWHAILDFYGSDKLPNWETAVEEAGKFHYKDAKNKDNASENKKSGKKAFKGCHPHQYHIYDFAKKQFLIDLQNNQTAIYNSMDFEKLYDNIEKFCKKKRIGELTIYDTAMRLGAFLGKLKGRSFKPQMVFLHNGAMEGAKKLFRRGEIAKPYSRMPLSAFAKCFPNKKTWEVEEILCIYKNNF